MRIAVDGMGGDYAPAEIIKGVLAAVDKVDDLDILLVGQRERLKHPDGGEINSPRIKIIHAEEIIGNHEDPGLAIRRKKKASLVAAMQLVCQGQADAVVSGGSTGALMAGGLLFLGRISGVSRPALLTVMPALRGERTVILDMGANMDARPEQMLQYALMGSIYAREMLSKDSPRLALLNVGVEPNKGNHQVRAAYRLFKEKLTGFVGNIEAKDIFTNRADVIICDGFAGNVMLKTMEGLSREIFYYFSEQCTENMQAVILSPHFSPLLQRLRLDLDEAEYGGALLIGVRGVCIKCHGASRQKAITQALLRQAYPLVRRKINEKIERALSGGWLKEEADDDKRQ